MILTNSLQNLENLAASRDGDKAVDKYFLEGCNQQYVGRKLLLHSQKLDQTPGVNEGVYFFFLYTKGSYIRVSFRDRVSDLIAFHLITTGQCIPRFGVCLYWISLIKRGWLEN
jgi:hypothetical protein